MVDVTTTAQLQGIMNDILVKVFDKVTKETLRVFRDEYIRPIVYDSHGPNKVYKNPLGDEFLESWQWQRLQVSATEVSQKMWQNWQEMSTVPNAFEKGDFGGIGIGIHGSWVGGFDPDERPYLAETLNKKGPSSSLWVSVSRPSGYWDTFIRSYVESGKLKQNFDAAFASFGIKSG